MRYERMLGIADRHNKLVELIRKGDYSSCDLATQLGVSEQTIYRDIAFLRQNGLRIESEKCSATWAYRIYAEPAKYREQKTQMPIELTKEASP